MQTVLFEGVTHSLVFKGELDCMVCSNIEYLSLPRKFETSSRNRERQLFQLEQTNFVCHIAIILVFAFIVDTYTIPVIILS